MNNKVVLAFIIVLVAAFFLRASALDWETFGYGEIEVKQAAQEYAKGNFVDNVYIFDTPPVGKYLFALSIVFFGLSELSLRIIPLLFGMLSIIAVYLIARKFYSQNVALLSAVITSFSILHIQLSRYVQLETMLAFFYIMIVYFLWSASSRPRSWIFLAVFLGLSVAVKFTSLIMVVVILVYALYSKELRLSLRPVSIAMSGWLPKALVLSFLVFLLAWPFGLQTLPVDANVSVGVGGTATMREFHADVPIMVMSFFARISSSVDGGGGYPLIAEVPVVNYFVLYIAKESLLAVALLVAGAYFIFRHPKKPDALVLIMIAVFLLSLSFQRTLITYRHIVPLVPFFAIISSRWLETLKENRQLVMISAVAVALFAYALLSGPSYALSYNPLKEALAVPDSEFRFSEGMKETIGYLSENCSSAYASGFYRFMIEPYYANVTSSFAGQPCIVMGHIESDNPVQQYVESEGCALAHRSSAGSVSLVDVYSCSVPLSSSSAP